MDVSKDDTTDLQVAPISTSQIADVEDQNSSPVELAQNTDDLLNSPGASKNCSHHATRSTSRKCCQTRDDVLLGKLLVDSGNPSPICYNVAYDTLSSLSKHAGYSLVSRHREIDEETPGPGAYKVQESLGSDGPKWSIAFRNPQVVDPYPGPFEYTPLKLKVQHPAAASYSMAAKTGHPLFYNSEETPASDQYYPQMPVQHVAATMKGRYKESKALKTPGPANYLIPSSIPSGPQCSIVSRGDYGPETNFPPLDPSAPVPGTRSDPGPSDYSPNARVSLPSGPFITLGAKWRNGPANCPSGSITVCSPGPQYSPTLYTVSSNDAPKPALKGKPTQLIKRTPGPADYAAPAGCSVADLIRIIEARKQAAIVTQKKRQMEMLARSQPNPGNDDEMSNITRSPNTEPHSPGPADYNTNQASRLVFGAAPKYTLSGRSNAVPKQVSRKLSQSIRTSVPTNKSTVLLKERHNRSSSGSESTIAPSVVDADLPEAEKVEEHTRLRSKIEKYQKTKKATIRGVSMKGRLGEAVLIFPRLRLDTLRANVNSSW